MWLTFESVGVKKADYLHNVGGPCPSVEGFQKYSNMHMWTFIQLHIYVYIQIDAHVFTYSQSYLVWSKIFWGNDHFCNDQIIRHHLALFH